MARRTDDSEHLLPYDLDQHKFMAMEPGKRERILDAAYREFSRGYLDANTEAIAANAGISKGLLFHYFGSKRGLLLYLIRYALHDFASAYEGMPDAGVDFLDRIRAGSKLKMDLTLQHPERFAFLIRAFASLDEIFPDGVPEDLHYATHVDDALRVILNTSAGPDESRLKPGIDPEMAANLIVWTMSGLVSSLFRYGDDVAAYRAHYDELTQEIDDYLRMLRSLLYREE